MLIYRNHATSQMGSQAQKLEFCLKQAGKIRELCLKQGQGLRDPATPPYLGICQEHPRRLLSR